MPIKTILLALLLLLTASYPTPNCPTNTLYSTIHQGRFTASATGTVILTSGTQALCYNYTLPAPFHSNPSVAVAISNLASPPTNDLFFSVHPSKTNSLSQLSFLIRTQWKYTQWTIIDISFIAENDPRLSTLSFTIDTTPLAGCSPTKEVKVILPYNQQSFVATNAVTYLHGFQMSSGSSGTCYSSSVSSFDVQVLNIGVSDKGVSIRVTATTGVRVYSVVVSVLAWTNQAQVIASTFQSTPLTSPNSLSFTTISPVFTSNAQLYGFSGFILSSSGSFSLSTQFDSSSYFTLTSTTTISYLSFSYFFIEQLPCGYCQGYPAYYNGQCLVSCPSSTYLSNGECKSCPSGYYWNGNQCVVSSQCPTGYTWNGTQCVINYQCPTGYTWNGTQCVQNSCNQCPSGYYWNGTQCVQSYSCPNGYTWNGTQCVQSCNQCPSGYYWNGTQCVQNSTQCPSGYYWNGTQCVYNYSCQGNQYWNGTNCVCPTNTYWNGTYCISYTCPSGYYWNGTNCVMNNTCPNGYYWNGTQCVLNNSCNNCPNGYYWNGTQCILNTTCGSGQQWNGTCCVPICSGGRSWNGTSCVCPLTTYWNGNSCISCSNGQTWCPTTMTCICPSNTYFNGYSCISCPTGQYWSSQTQTCSCPLNQHWNGFNCISCIVGQYWCNITLACKCPENTYLINNKCITCPSNQHWNGYNCISCPNSQQWNNISMICQCPTGQQYNGTNCVILCPATQINVGGICQCQDGYYLVNTLCKPLPSCPSGQVWNNTSCNPIVCPIGKYWNGLACTGQVFDCPAGTYYDGCKCIATTGNCPSATSWNGNICTTSSNQCPNGYYMNNNTCNPISCQCPPSMHYTSGQCLPLGNQCPNGTYYNGQGCIPTISCSNGKVWNSTYAQCMCAYGLYWNSYNCISCSGGQIYDNGCVCPQGTFWNGSSCLIITLSNCPSIVNAQWINNRCQCHNGYISEGSSCICKGLVNNGLCDPCYLKPNSIYKYGICQCKVGYYDINGQCKQYSPLPTPQSSCNVGTYLDNQQKRCLPCSDGCLSCTSCYECTQCRPQYTYNHNTKLCDEICGDGKRFTLQCDDGNNNNGDGCSSDCKIQQGYHCIGGSPNSKDNCSAYKPQQLVFTLSGQSHIRNKIVLNVRSNYLPKALIQSNDCKHQCSDILAVDVISGDKGTISINAQYIPTTSYSFSIELDYGRQPIGLFRVRIGIKSGIALKYLNGIQTSSKLQVDVNPAFLSLYGAGSQVQEDTLV